MGSWGSYRPWQRKAQICKAIYYDYVRATPDSCRRAARTCRTNHSDKNWFSQHHVLEGYGTFDQFRNNGYEMWLLCALNIHRLMICFVFLCMFSTTCDYLPLTLHKIPLLGWSTSGESPFQLTNMNLEAYYDGARRSCVQLWQET